jgi:demethylmenaquinone methyltransferase/2-methoxy-6-polyprenyl-1,4-benzoquinol methylase
MEKTTEKQEFFNGLAEKWDESTRHDMTKVRTMLNLLGIERGHRVLDVGTGTGVLIPLLTEHTGEADITAIDFSPNMIAGARKKFEGSAVTFIAADVLTHPFENGSFDFVICYSVFPHLENHEEALRRLAGLLKPGGLLAIMHSTGRQTINMGHSHFHAVMHDRIPLYNVLCGAMRARGLREEIMIDNARMYMVCARRL